VAAFAREPSPGAILIPAADRARALTSPTVIGSDPAQADVVIADAAVSPRHALLMLDDGDGNQWKIVDLGSAHGTLVDGVRIHGERVLTGSHELQLGRTTVTVVVERAVRLIAGSIVRGEAAVALDPIELALVQILATAHDVDAGRPETMRGFVKVSELAHLVPATADLATPMIRQLARRLERRLAALGGPPVLEACERRGYRLRARLGKVEG